jgi:zinc transport system substrate-binding protein
MRIFRESVRALAVAALWTSGAPAQAELKVVVTSKPIHALVAGVMNGVGSPALLVDGPASPHTYAMKPSDAQKAQRADIFFRVSDGLEPFTAKLVKSLPKTVRVATLGDAQGLTLLERRSGGTFEDDEHGGGKGHRHEHGGAKENHDPHVWLDPDNAKAMVKEIAKVLAERAPDQAHTFTANATALNARIDALAVEIESQLMPVSGKPFIVFHDAYQYLERRFGLPAAGAITINPDERPSGKRLSALRKKVMKLGAMCVFAEPLFEPKLTNAIVEGTRVKTGILDPEGVTLQAGPDLYFQLMRNLAAGLKACLGAS